MNAAQSALANQIQETATELVNRLFARGTGEKQATSAVRGGMPLAVVIYEGKRLGVFWIGIGRDKKPTVGLRKLVKSGHLHRGHRRFAPAYWVEISELAAHGNS